VVLALNVAVREPAATVTDGGSVSAEDVPASVTAAPPCGAPALRVTVQLKEAPETTGVVGQVSALNTAADDSGVTVTVVVAFVALSEAVIVTLWLLVTIAAAAENAPDVLPAGMFTDPGIAMLLVVGVSDTMAPPAGAAAVSVTVQAADDPAGMEVGLQVTADTPTGAGPVNEIVKFPAVALK
jgi:hypothetical protein